MDTPSPQIDSLRRSPATCTTQIQAPQPAWIRLSIPIWERTVSLWYHTSVPSGPTFRPHLHICFCQLLSWKNLPAQGTTSGDRPTHLGRQSAGNTSKVSQQPRIPKSIANWIQAQSNHTTAILFDSEQLRPDNQQRKLRLLGSMLQLDAPDSKSWNQWTGVEQRALYPAEKQGTWVWIPQVDNPQSCTPTLIIPGSMFYKRCQGNST